MSLAEQQQPGCCAWCAGETDDYLTTDGLLICQPCFIDVVFKDEEARRRTFGPLSPEQRFEALFRAARALLNEGVGHEDVVLPTLVLANNLDLGCVRDRLSEASQNPGLWKVETDRFTRVFPQLRPIDVIEGAVIVERTPVSVEIVNYAHPHIVVPKHIAIEVRPSFRMVKPEQVAHLYERHLAAAALSHSEQWVGSMSWDFWKGRSELSIRIEYPYTSASAEVAASSLPEGGPRFAHPFFVGRYYEMLMGTAEGPGFAKYLIGRSRGRSPVADALVPAATAAILRYHAGVESPKAVHRLLNEHVLRDGWKTLPEGYSSSESNQLWRDVKKVKHWLLNDMVSFSALT